MSKANPRSCQSAGCTACCVVPGIKTPELTKDGYVPCPHLGAVGSPAGSCTGCTIYSNDPRRPHVCATYQCYWLADEQLNGELGLDLRDNESPAECGLLIEYSEPRGQLNGLLAGTSTGRLRIITVWECWPGALQEYKATKVIKRLLRKYVVILFDVNGNDYVFGPPKEQVAVDAIKQAGASINPMPIEETTLRTVEELSRLKQARRSDSNE